MDDCGHLCCGLRTNPCHVHSTDPPDCPRCKAAASADLVTGQDRGSPPGQERTDEIMPIQTDMPQVEPPSDGRGRPRRPRRWPRYRTQADARP
jgi:hypothetical protein